tara:strand:- start:284 stop:583 length:300 start_codon:yes stop_codon:yes gene_type:complete
MAEIKKISLTKKDISKKINLKTGLSNLYTKKITDDLINILKYLIKTKEINIKNFASFKTINKNKRLGRNPKNKKVYTIKARRSLSFITSKNLSAKIKNI